MNGWSDRVSGSARWWNLKLRSFNSIRRTELWMMWNIGLSMIGNKLILKRILWLSLGNEVWHKRHRGLQAVQFERKTMCMCQNSLKDNWSRDCQWKTLLSFADNPGHIISTVNKVQQPWNLELLLCNFVLLLAIKKANKNFFIATKITVTPPLPPFAVPLTSLQRLNLTPKAVSYLFYLCK